MILKQFLRFSELSSGKNIYHNSEHDHQTEVQPRLFTSKSLFPLTAYSARCQQVEKKILDPVPIRFSLTAETITEVG